jgi:hypothetical protein
VHGIKMAFIKAQYFIFYFKEAIIKEENFIINIIKNQATQVYRNYFP